VARSEATSRVRGSRLLKTCGNGLQHGIGPEQREAMTRRRPA
jgi:hypothetical protein